MNKEKLNSLIQHPNQLVTGDTEELLELIQQYPYFQTAHLLLLYNLRASGQEVFDHQLLSSALFLADRSKFFNFVNAAAMVRIVTKDEEISAVEVTVNEVIQVDHSDFLLEENLPVENLVEHQFPIVEENPRLKTELLDLDESDEKQVYPDETPREIIFSTENTNVGADKLSLIDKFLDDIPVFTPTRIVPGEPEKDIASESIKEDEECVSETLAAIYMNQQLFASAISVYEKLILKYPEKSTYFASRVEEIKKLLK